MKKLYWLSLLFCLGCSPHAEFQGKEVLVKLPGEPIKGVLLSSVDQRDLVLYQDKQGWIHEDWVPIDRIEIIGEKK